MTVFVKALIPIKTAETAVTTQYTAQNVTTIIDKFTATNYSAADATLTVYLTNPGETASTTSAVVLVQVVSPNETYTFPEVAGHALAPGGTIATAAGTALALAIRASGREVTQ